METSTAVAIADAWIHVWSREDPADVREGVEESALDWELPRKAPGLCLAAIVEVLHRVDASKPSKLLAALAAGPLEDLLSHNGPVVVEEVDRLARQSPEFRRLLNGVWDSSIPAEVLARLAKYRTDPW